MLLNQPLFSLNSHHTRKKIVQNHFNHLIQNTPKHVVEIHEFKNKQEPKPNVPTQHHVLFDFCPTEPVNNIVEPEPPLEKNDIAEPESPLEKDDIVEYVVDDYIDIGEIYNAEFENSDYNPMYFSLRHYISSK